jgi:PLP dependent protein
MSIKENLLQIRSTLPKGVQLVAVSKTKSIDQIMEAYQTGQRIFGENKVQELLTKWEALPKDIEWHYIGHLQSNKVKYIAPFIAMIHAVDSLKILNVINEEGKRAGREIPCLLQFHIAQEESKFGFQTSELDQLLSSADLAALDHIIFSGVMGMATYTDDNEVIDREFSTLHTLFEKLKLTYFSQNDNFREISMGMSHDYLLAIENGSTMVRIGSTLFGERYLV